MKLIFRLFLPFLYLLIPHFVSGQDGTIKGKTFDEVNRPISKMVIRIEGTETKAVSDSNGQFSFTVPPGKYVLVLNHLNYQTSKEEVIVRPAGTEIVNVKMLTKEHMIGTINITDQGDPKSTQDPDRAFIELLPIAPEKIVEITSLKSDLSNRLATMGAGVSTNNELSSQYRVRGGNYDENLIYVNDIEIYRPFLIRSGQQEGLGFVNTNLISEVGFSSGGFQAKYGDKLSSILDVRYRTPSRFGGSAEIGVLNLNLHFEGRLTSKKKQEANDYSKKGRFTYLIGARRFTPSYVLNSLDTKGDYTPAFHDVQGMFTYVPRQRFKEFKLKERKDGVRDTIYYPAERFRLTFFSNVAHNRYQFVPEARETTFGTIQNVFRLRVAFEGREITEYLTGLGALVLENRPNLRLRVKHIFTAFQTREREVFDVEGGYWLSDVNTNFGSEGYNEIVFDRGIGTFFRHARNYLTASVISAEQRGEWYAGHNFNHKISWGLRVQNQIINDELSEWNGVDSARYFTMLESYRSAANLNSFQYKIYLQDHWKISKDNSKRLILGGRVLYNTLNDQLLFSPRLQFVIDPASRVKVRDLDASEYGRDTSRNWQLRFAVGIYHQPPFYREMRDFDGAVNVMREAQSSAHFIIGGDYLFKIWGRPFKLFAEGYYKKLDNLVPYEVQNVRIRYYPFHYAEGYAIGADARVTGEFIKGVDSWMSLGILRTQERLLEKGEAYLLTPDALEKGYVSRPTDQRLTFGMYFQDEMPMNPTYKVHINFVYGSGLRFGPPKSLVNRTEFRVPSYQRVDLGFSKLLVFKAREERAGKFSFESIWISAEIFNLFQRSNTVSYVWIKDVYDTQFAVPNFLSARLLNLRLLVRF